MHAISNIRACMSNIGHVATHSRAVLDFDSLYINLLNYEVTVIVICDHSFSRKET